MVSYSFLAFSDVQLILDDFLNEMDFEEVLSLGSLVAAYTQQPSDINGAPSGCTGSWRTTR